MAKQRVLNKDALREVRDWIAEGRMVLAAAAAPNGMEFKGRFDLAETISHSGFPILLEPEKGAGECGAICCIAGAGLAFDAIKRLKRVTTRLNALATMRFVDHDDEPSRGTIAGNAARLFGLPDEDALHLFNPAGHTWKEEDKDGNEIITDYGFDNSDVTNAHAVAVLDHLIATGVVDWNVGRPDGY